MKKGTKLIVLVLIASVVMSVCSCSEGKPAESNKATVTETTKTIPETTKETASETTEEPTTTTEAPLNNYELSEVYKVMVQALGKDVDAAQALFEEFFGMKFERLDPRTLEDHTNYELIIKLKIDNVPCKYLTLTTMKDKDIVYELAFSADLESREEIHKYYLAFTEKLLGLYGKPSEQETQDSLEYTAFKINKNVRSNVGAYYEESNNSFWFDSYNNSLTKTGKKSRKK